MVEVKFLGATMLRYDGLDPATNAHLHIDKGVSVKVSDEKAKQLKADFPKDFEFGKSDAPKLPDAKDKSVKGYKNK